MDRQSVSSGERTKSLKRPDCCKLIKFICRTIPNIAFFHASNHRLIILLLLRRAVPAHPLC